MKGLQIKWKVLDIQSKPFSRAHLVNQNVKKRNEGLNSFCRTK